MGNTTQGAQEIDWAPNHGDCRAASNSAHGDTQVTCAGEQTQTHLQSQLSQLPPTFGELSNKSTRGMTLGIIENPHNADPHRSHSFVDFTQPDSEHGPLLGAPGPEVVSIQGGGKPNSKTGFTAKHTGKMEPSYASTTECILQNLTMAVGNPSARCFAPLGGPSHGPAPYCRKPTHNRGAISRKRFRNLWSLQSPWTSKNSQG